MKRMSIKLSPPDISFNILNSNGHQSASNDLKKKSPCCWISIKKMYILLVMTVILLLWVIIYYKVLNHPFELPEPLNRLREMFGDGKVKRRNGREEETETIVLSTRKSCLPQFKTERNPEVIHFAIVACLERYEDALVSMKSITLITNYNIYFHIFTDERHIQKETFDRELVTWPGWKEHWMMFVVYPIHYPGVQNKIDWLHLFKPCASQRLFLATILSDVDALIYIDTDTLFLEAPENLWDSFKKFDESQIAGLVPECDNARNCHYNSKLMHPYFEPYGLNSGVMLMNLTSMRKLKWEKTLIEIYSKYKDVLLYGDQDILNIYFQSRRNKLYSMLCHWNYRPDQCMYGNTCDQVNRTGVSVLHGNRQVFKKQNLQPEFYIIYEAFRKFKFEESFQKVVVDSVKKALYSKKSSHCGKMSDAFLKHIVCTNVLGDVRLS